MLFRARQFEFRFPRPTLLLGIVNVTPDSFSDGGQYAETDRAVAHGLDLVAQGADLLDIGGESTRPGASPVSEAEELRRVLPVVEKLAAQVRVPLSIDTMKPAVARAAVAAGASLINDVAAHRRDATMAAVVAETGAGYVAMHMQGSPATMQQAPAYGDVVAEVTAALAGDLDFLRQAGVAAEQVVVDAGIGFGKNLEHNLQLLARMRHLTRLGRPVLLGVSRKSFLGGLTGAEIRARLHGALAATVLAVAQGVQIIRTHDVAETGQALRVATAILGRQQA
jgi:dihydropteroate synthase